MEVEHIKEAETERHKYIPKTKAIDELAQMSLWVQEEHFEN